MKLTRLSVLFLLVSALLFAPASDAAAQKEEKALQKVLASKNLKEIYEIRALKIKAIAERTYSADAKGVISQACGGENISRYDENGIIIENEIKKYDEASKQLVPVQKWVSKLNAGQQPELEILYYYDAKRGSYEESKKWVYEYDDKQNLIVQTLSDAQSGDVIEKFMNKYDEKNNRIESACYNGVNHSYTKIYRYDGNKNELESVKSNPVGEVIERITNAYDEAGLKTETAVYCGTCLAKKTTFNKLACELDIEKYSQGKLASTVHNVYDDSGNKTEETEISAAGKRFYLEAFAYDQLNNLTEKVRYGSDNTIESKESFKYDEMNRKINEYYYGGTPLKLHKSVNNQFNDLRKITETKAFDEKQKPMYKTEFAYEYNQ
jgi:hypothetical protein